MMARYCCVFSRAFTITICSLGLLVAQSDRGTVTGTVTDKTGAVIPTAKVTVTNIATNGPANTEANESGVFVVPNLQVGKYTIRIEREGFRPAVITGVDVDPGGTVRADVSLEVGTATTAVEVSAQAVQLQTDNARSATTVTDKLINDLPVVVGGALRSPFDLAILTPESKSFNDNGFAIGGGQAASYAVNLDGISANTTRALSQSWVATNTPSLEAITEFAVETNGFKAEFGHAGGGAIQFVSRSGTNDLHGSGYEFLRNNFFDANTFFGNAAGRPRAVYKQHDFGATLGGPVWIPKVYNGKNKTFFFFSWEAFRIRQGANAYIANVPTPEMLNGDFSVWVDNNNRQLAIYDPYTTRNNPNFNASQPASAANPQQIRDPFPGNVIPKSRWDPLSAKALSVFTGSGTLAPNRGFAPGTSGYVRNNYLNSAGTEVKPQNKYSWKVDHNFNDRNRISGYFGINRANVDPGPDGPPNTLPGLYADYNNTVRDSEVYRFSWDTTITPTLVNRFYTGANNWRENHDPPQAGLGPWGDKFCLPNAPNCNDSLIQLRFSGYNNWGGVANNGSENTIYQVNDDLTKVLGKHTLKGGIMWQRGHYNGFGRQCVMGCSQFNSNGTSIPTYNDPFVGGGNSFASFLLGWAADGSLDTVRFIGQQWPYFAGYFQDDWKVTSRLTVNLGLRWETTLPPVEQDDKWSDFAPTRPNPGADNRPGALIFAGTGTGREGSRSLADSWWAGFGPRIGFAYALNDRTVIRANFARSFSQVTTTTGSTHQKGFTQTTSFGDGGSNGVQRSYQFSQGLPPYPVPPFITPTFQNGFDMPWWQNGEVTRLPENLAYNLSIQRQLSNTFVMEVAYNALIGTHLQAGILNYNQVDPKYLQQYGYSLLTKRIDSPEAVAAGIPVPYANFVRDFGSRATVAQALRPFPQYTDINTWDGNGDHSGHSTYHAGTIKLDKRYSSGISFTTSYVFSKLITDADSYWITEQSRAADQYNRRLEKSIGSYDATHNFKLGLSYELPFGKGKAFLNNGAAAYLLGGWRISTIHLYTSGRPIGIGTNNCSPLFSGRCVPYLSTFDNLRADYGPGGFDPNRDRFLRSPSQIGVFNAAGQQPNATAIQTAGNFIGNAPRYLSELREFPYLTENLSVAKLFKAGERFQAELRGEAFNLLNRVRFGAGGTTITDPANFGLVTSQANTPRQIQLGLKLLF